MAPATSNSGSTTSVQVAVRIRPITTQDATSIPPRFQRIVINDTSATSVVVDATNGPPTQTAQPVTGAPAKKQSFNFDQVHGQSTTQYQLYTSTAQPLVGRFLEGFNCTILAYGQTSSGKTHSMTGVDLDADPTDPSNGMGIVPRAVAAIFAKAQELKSERSGGWQYSLKGSFIELYNEDLIDLLVDDASGVRREVQIREDKDGHIIWGGLREVNVRNAAEVMSLLRQGTSIRRTNETDMNAQSSRSHAIFSLTLTQKKYTGSGVPPRSTSPLPQAGRSPSRLARPSSTYISRVGSPTTGRPPTPSFANAMSRGGLRPSSALGHRSGEQADEDEGPGSWTTIVSKFHFVDLAGSERLKRTAAQGDRVKEGISINSGLLALGNVISALGDPSKARTTTHVPYRDSKLTRLLQDSLGGNAHTLMIACVSPAEWNVAETVNTLKYANRARNIKNRAEIREKEEGWDDVDWLQSMVSKLRKELKVIKEGGTVPTTTSGQELPSGSGGGGGGANARILEQMVELQSNYEDLRSRFTDRTEELTRLRRELDDRRHTGGAVGASRKYEEIVGPVIEEYEKTISAMEAELSLNRAALRHTNEMYLEKEEEFDSLAIRHAATEAYVDELRHRLGKLTERESANESYIRDLEAKLKAVDDTAQSSNTSVAELRREIARFKDVEAHSAQHIADLEARLAQSDASVLALRETIESLEIQSDSRLRQIEDLDRQLSTLTKDREDWRAELEGRELRLSELEEKLKQWEQAREQAADDRARLGNIEGNVAKARESLDIEVAKAEKGNEKVSDGEASPLTELQVQHRALQETHTATLADLSAVSDKYRDALREISDLAGQIAELKLQNVQSEPPEEPPAPQYDSMSLGRRRGMAKRANLEMFENSGVNFNTNGNVNGNGNGTGGRRLFFRQAASAESLHARSQSQSPSLSQELSSARTPKHSLTNLSMNGVSLGNLSPASATATTPKISLLGSSAPSSAPQTPSDDRGRSVQSLEKEIMRLQEVLKERETEISALETSLKEVKQPPKKHLANGNVSDDEDNQPSNGKLSPTMMKRFARLRHSLIIEQPPKFPDNDTPGESESLDRLDELMRSMAQKESQHKEEVDELSNQLTRLTRQHEDLTVLSRDQAMNMSTELGGLRSQLQEVEAQRAELQSQLVELQKREAEVVEAHALAASDSTKALEALKAEHTVAIASHSEEAATRLAQAVQELATAKANHEAALIAKQNEVDALIQRISADHEGTLSRLHKEISEAEARALKIQEEKEIMCKELKAEHATALKSRSDELENLLSKTREAQQQAVHAHERGLAEKEREHASSLQTLRNEHESFVSRLRSEHQKSQADAIEVLRAQHEEALRAAHAEHETEATRRQETAALALKQAQTSHEEEVQKLKTSNEEALSRKEADLNAQIARLKEDHSASIKQAELAREGSLSDSQEAQQKAIQQLQEQHTEDIRRREQAYSQDLESAKSEHARILEQKEKEHDAAIAKMKATYEEQAKAAEDAFGQQLADVVKRVGDQHLRVVEKADAEFVQKLNELTAEHGQKMSAKEAEFNELMAKQKAEHATAIAELQQTRTRLETELQALEASFTRSKEEFESYRREQENSLTALRQEHATSLANLSAVKEERDRERARLTEALAKSDSALESLKSASKSELGSVIANAQQEQANLISSISKEHEAAITQLKAEFEAKLATLETEKDTLLKTHADELLSAKNEHQVALASTQNELNALREQHQTEIEELRLEHDMLVAEEREQQAQALSEVDDMHFADREALQRERDMLAVQVEELTTAANSATDLAAQLQQMRSDHELALNEKLVVITRLEMEITTVMKERREYSQQVALLKSELERAQITQPSDSGNSSKRQSLAEELDRHRSVIGDLRVDLQRTKDAMDNLQAEKARQDVVVKELQAQLVAYSTSDGQGSNDSHDVLMTPRSAKMNGVPPSKPPPSGALPSLPNGAHVSKDMYGSISSRSATLSSLHSPTDSMAGPSTPATSILASVAQVEPKLNGQVDELTRQIEEQDTMIKTLNKQLTHCEGDLQAHMDLVQTLESSLNDSERNLRKARLQATELARERDTLQHHLDTTRNELQDAKREVVNVRMSIVEEKQSLEQRLDEERKAKERARAQLDSRMEELAKRKSKFACM